MENSLLKKKSKAEESPWLKKKSFVKATGTGGAPRCHSDYEQNKMSNKFWNEVSFYLCKYQPWYENVNNRLES